MIIPSTLGRLSNAWKVALLLLLSGALPASLLPTGFPASEASSYSAKVETSENPIDWLKELVGEWEGTSALERDPGNIFPARVSYSLTGSGSAVVENLDLGGHKMTSVYHEDQGALRMTHFCSAGNQPRLTQSDVDAQNHSVSLELVDITNLTSPGAFHVIGWKIHPQDDRLVITITAAMGGSRRRERVELVRAK